MIRHYRSTLRRKALAASTASIALSAFAVTGVAAQTLPEAQPPVAATQVQAASAPAEVEDATQASETGVADILVTARKQTERAVEVPISLVTIDNAQMTSRGITQMQDIAVYVPNFRQSNGAAGTFRSIRGGGSPGSNFAFEQSTGMFFDNISYGRNVHSFVPIFDVERVEILRGPQVITFGNSTTAGAISVSSRLPGTRFAGNFDTTYEFNNDELVLRGGIDVPIADNVAVRVSGFGQILDRGWVRNIRPTSTFDGPKFRNFGGRIVVLATPTPSLTAKFKYEHDNVLTRGTSLQAVFNPANDPNIVEAELDGVSFSDQPAPYDGRRDRIRMINHSLLLELSQELGDQTLVSTTGYTYYTFDQTLDGDAGPRPIANTQPRDKYKQFSQELRLFGPLTDRLSYSAGLFYQHEEQNPRSLFNNGVVFGRLAALDTKADQVSVFGEAKWKATDKLSIDVALRYSNISRVSDQYVIGTIPLTFTPTSASPILPRFFNDIETPDEFFMPQVVVSYQPSRDVNFFAKFVQGNKAGGVDLQYVAPPATANVASATFAAEAAKSYEAGVKSYLFGRAVSLDVVLFRSDLDNLQVSSLNALTSSFETRNAASARSQGVEVDAVFVPAPGLRLNASFAYLDAKFRNFPQGPCTAEQALLVVGRPCFQDLSGARTPFNSAWSGTGGVEYKAELGSYTITPRVDAIFRSSFNQTTNNDPLLQADGFVVLDSRIDFAPLNGRYTLGVFAKNLTNVIYNEVALGAPFTNRVRLGDTSRGRQIGIAAGFKF